MEIILDKILCCFEFCLMYITTFRKQTLTLILDYRDLNLPSRSPVGQTGEVGGWDSKLKKIKISNLKLTTEIRVM